jgi:hypothetical protein
VLQKVDAQHDPEAHWLPTFARLGVMRFDQGFQLGPGNYRFHAVEKLRPASGAGKLFKTRLAGKGYLAHRVFALPAILSNCNADAGLDQRLLKKETLSLITGSSSNFPIQGLTFDFPSTAVLSTALPSCLSDMPI